MSTADAKASTASPNTASPRTANPWLVLLVLCLGFFMIMLDTTIVNIAVPAMLDGLSASLDQIVWVVNSYLLAYAALLITGGRLGDRYGPRNLFAIGLVLFTLASVGCGLAQNSAQMITARVIQGVGGALLTPQTLVIITMIFPKERRGAALGVWGSIIGLSTVAGPTVGGLLVNNASWRWIFFVNVPIGLIALIGTFRIVPDLRLGRSHGMDMVGVALVTAGLFALVYGLIEGQRYDWGTIAGPISIPLVLGVGVVLLVAFVLWERRPAEPLLPLSLFRHRNYSIMLWLQTLIAFGMLGVFLPLVLVLQSVLGMSALRAGLTIAPLSVAAMVVAPLAGGLADRFGAKYILMAGTSLFALGIGLLVPVIELDATVASFAIPMVVAGIGLGMCLAPLAAEAMREIPPLQAGAASGMLNTTRQIGGLIGTAVVGAVLQNRLAVAFTDQARERVAALPADVQQRFVDGFANANSSGFQVAPGQTGGAQLPSGLPADVQAAVQQAAHDVFVNGFVAAARPSVLVPAAVVALATVSCVAIVPRRRATDTAQPAEQPVAKRPAAEPTVAAGPA